MMKKKKKKKKIHKKKKKTVFEKKEKEKVEKKLIQTDEKNKKRESESSTNSADSCDRLIAGLSLEPKKDLKRKKKSAEKKITIDNNSKKNNLVAFDQFIIKNITGDGNCFYRTLSYYYRETENDHKEFRELIVKYIEKNPAEYYFYISDQDIGASDNTNESIKNNMKNQFIINYAKIASKDGEWAGDIEIATACTLLNCNIIMYTLNSNGYSIYNNFSPNNNNNENIGNTINILYINNNHFNLLLPNDNNNTSKRNTIQKEISFKEFEKILFKEKKKYNRNLNGKLRSILIKKFT